jgi:hypothetical protein
VLLVHADRVIGLPVEDDLNIRILVHEQIREQDIETLREFSPDWPVGR